MAFDKDDMKFLTEQFDKINGRFEQIDGRFEQIDGKFEQIDGRFEQIDGRFDKIDSDIRFLDRKIDQTKLDLIDEINRVAEMQTDDTLELVDQVDDHEKRISKLELKTT